MKKAKKMILFLIYQIVAGLPKSSSPFPWPWPIKNGRLRSWVGGKVMNHCGKHVNIERNACFSSHLSMGDYSGLGVNARIQGKVTIGNYVMMGQDVLIYTSNHEFSDTSIPMCQQKYKQENPVTICDDVWIGSRVVILPGVTINKGAIIGAGGVVSKDVPAYAVVVGNPARIVKYRYEPPINESEVEDIYK